MRLAKQLELLRELVELAKDFRASSLKLDRSIRRLARAWDEDERSPKRAPKLPVTELVDNSQGKAESDA